MAGVPQKAQRMAGAMLRKELKLRSLALDLTLER